MSAADPPAAPRNRGWHRSGRLPHCDVANLVHVLTYRLAGALPRGVVTRLLLETHDDDQERRRRFEGILDAGYGSCLLGNDGHARIVVDQWLRYDGERYRLHEWVVMPNHVQVIVEVDARCPLDRIVQGWKSCTSRAIARRSGHDVPLWQADYWDRYVRDERHYAAARRYVRENPVVAGLVERAQAWRWSSAAQA